jgi:hypothetical protein
MNIFLVMILFFKKKQLHLILYDYCSILNIININFKLKQDD